MKIAVVLLCNEETSTGLDASTRLLQITDLKQMFNCKKIEDARKKRDQVLADYQEYASSAMECLDEGFKSAITVMTLPEGMRRFFWTLNHIERLNRELKWRSGVIGIFPNEALLIRLMGSVLMEQKQHQSGRKGNLQQRILSESAEI